MAVPKRRKSKSKRDSRRAHHDRLTLPILARCSRCGTPRLPHRACPRCGFYKDRQVVVVPQRSTASESA